MLDQILTTGEAAKLCGVSQQTIIRQFILGNLKGFLLPGSNHRRIPKGELLRFAQRYKIPVIGKSLEEYFIEWINDRINDLMKINPSDEYAIAALREVRAFLKGEKNVGTQQTAR